MKVIEHPTTLAERIVNAVCEDLYGRSGGDWFLDAIPDDVLRDELVPELVAVVQEEIDKGGL